MGASGASEQAARSEQLIAKLPTDQIQKFSAG